MNLDSVWSQLRGRLCVEAVGTPAVAGEHGETESGELLIPMLLGISQNCGFFTAAKGEGRSIASSDAPDVAEKLRKMPRVAGISKGYLRNCNRQLLQELSATLMRHRERRIANTRSPRPVQKSAKPEFRVSTSPE